MSCDIYGQIFNSDLPPAAKLMLARSQIIGENGMDFRKLPGKMMKTTKEGLRRLEKLEQLSGYEQCKKAEGRHDAVMTKVRLQKKLASRSLKEK